MSDKPRYLIVTAAQFSEGYLEKRGNFIYRRQYRRVGTRPDGNIVVIDPQQAIEEERDDRGDSPRVEHP